MNIGVVGHIDIGRTTEIAAHIVQQQKTAVEIINEQHEKQIAQHKEFVRSRINYDFAQPNKSGKELRRERRKANRSKSPHPTYPRL